MWSGRATMWAGNPRHYVRALTADIGRTYPQLGKVAVDYAWSGTFGNSIHGMPQIGELGPGVWLASGFGGHGLNTTAMAGNLIARAIVDGDQTWRQFTPFELVWAGGRLGRAVAQIYYWTRRFRDALAERRASTGEIALRRARQADMMQYQETELAMGRNATADEGAATTASSASRVEATAAEIQAPIVEIEAAIPGDDGPPPMIAIASRRGSQERSEETEA